jgi:hypothetical protein
MNVYDKGDLVLLSANFVNASNVATNPTTNVLKTKDPAGLIVIRTPTTNPSTGRFEYQLSLTGLDAQSGQWSYWWQGTGAVQAVEEAQFKVRESAFP